MIRRMAEVCRKRALGAAFAALATLVAAPVAGQGIQSVDPDMAIDGDLARSGAADYDGGQAYQVDEPSNRYEPSIDYGPASSRYEGRELDLPPEQATTTSESQSAAPVVRTAESVDPGHTYGEDDLIGAAEGLFGKGAEGLARVIEDILREQGEPNGYIVGREGGGAFIFGVRYGSGTLFHAVEGNMPIYWTGPSIGFDAGANAGNTFVLVYNVHDTEELYERFPAGEGQAYFVGGFNASYLRKGNIVLIPIRVGAGLRLGVNAGYMKFSKEQRWLPF